MLQVIHPGWGGELWIGQRAFAARLSRLRCPGRRGRRARPARALIDPALEGSRLLVVLGAAGMGKSVLLAETAQRARAAGMRVLAVTGLEPEADLVFAAAVPPGVGRRGRATPATGHGSTGALGFATEPVARDQFLTGIAALTLLSDASKLSPVLVVVDDAHWVAYELRKSGPTWSRDR